MQQDKPRLLIVDDAPENLHLLGNVLAEDYQLSVARSGPEALAIIGATPPDLILLDIMMPGMDGYEVCRRLKNDKRTCTIPVVFLTAKSEIEDEAVGLELGAVDYIVKPAVPSLVLARVKTHIALYDQYRLLENMVLERTRELDHARAEAEQASRAKSIFLSNISHELRTPLNHIQGFSSLMLETDPGIEYRQPLETIRESSKNLTKLFNNLLALTELDAGVFDLKKTPFSLRNTIGTLVKHYKVIADRKNLKLYYEIDSRVGDNFVGDSNKLSHVLNNMVMNALHYTKEGYVKILIERDRYNFTGIDLKQVMIKFTITDTGVGIPEEKQGTIFESFAIGEEVITKRLCGAGVGLAISSQIVEKLGGKIWLQSEVGHGSTFCASVPLQLGE